MTLVVLAGVASGVAPTLSNPPSKPDHDVDESTFHTLWSGDVDEGEVQNDSIAMAELAAYVDIPFDAPPAAVAQWNAGDHREFPATDWNTSVAPATASVTDGEYVRDAYVSAFAVSPSTRAHLSPTETPLYVGPDGTVRAALDYRVHVPTSENTSTGRVSWTVRDHEVSAVRLLVDGQLEDDTSGTHAPVLSYDRLDKYPGTDHDLTVEADVTVSLERTVETRVRRCEDEDAGPNTTCSAWRVESTSVYTETVTVEDTVAVEAYELVASVRAVEYPDGDSGIAVNSPQPWRGFDLDTGSVTGRWSFYSARDRAWDTLTRRTSNRSVAVESPAQPLQVHAYPSPERIGQSATSEGDVRVLASNGIAREAPSLPERIELGVANGSYTPSDRVAVRTDPLDAGTTVQVHGLVRGVSVERPLSTVQSTRLAGTTLAVEVLETTPDNVTLEVTLRDAETGAPINTDYRTGVIHIGESTVRTGDDGTGTVTVPRRSVYNARYEPRTWWDHGATDLGSGDHVYVAGSVGNLVDAAFRAGVPLGVVLFAVFLVDRITGWRIWPPWRRVR